MKEYKDVFFKIENFSTSQNSYAKFSEEDINIPKTCYNFKEKNGVLIGGNGFKKLNLPYGREVPREREISGLPDGVSCEKLWHYKYYSNRNFEDEYMLVVLGSDKKLYYNSTVEGYPTFSLIAEKTFSGDVEAITFRVNGEDVIGFSSPSDNLFVWYCDKAPYEVPTAPKFKSICLHNERLFAITTNNGNDEIRFSSILNPLEWTQDYTQEGAGKVELNNFEGEAKKLISLGDNVYIIRDYGISKITSYSSKSNFTCNNIYNSSKKIYDKTACICEDKIFFLAEDGLYSCDGFKVKKEELFLGDEFISFAQDNAFTSFFEGKLYIACKLFNNTENNKNNSIIEFNLSNKTYSITYGLDICSLLAVNDLFVHKMICAVRNSSYLFEVDASGKFNGNPLEKIFETREISIGNYQDKNILKDVMIKLLSPITLEIITDKASKKFEVNGSEKLQKFRCNLVGKTFKVKLSSVENNQRIEKLQLHFAVEKR